jgi:hypothetical protein
LLLTAGSPREGGYHVKMQTTDNALVSVTAALKARVEVLSWSQNLPAGHRGRL